MIEAAASDRKSPIPIRHWRSIRRTRFAGIAVAIAFLLLPGSGVIRAEGGEKVSGGDAGGAGPPVAVAERPAPSIDSHSRDAGKVSTWIEITPRATDVRPSAGEDCAAVYCPSRHSLIIFGGKNDADLNGNELWELDLHRRVWRQILPVGAAPPPSEDHSIIYDPGGERLIVFGGENGPTTNQLWSFDLGTRRWRSLSDSTTPYREDHTAIFDSRAKRMVVFGGQENGADSYGVWALDLDRGSKTFEKWSDLTVEADHPDARVDHIAVYDSLKNRMVVWGGWDKAVKGYLADAWAYTFSSSPDSAGRWTPLKTKWSRPPKRRHAVGVYDSRHNWLIMHGGFGEQGYLNDVWAFDLTNDLWINITPGPQPRLDSQAIYDPVTGRLVVYGGDARLPTKFHDLWELEVAPDLPLDTMLKVAGSKHPEAVSAADSTWRATTGGSAPAPGTLPGAGIDPMRDPHPHRHAER